MFEELHLCSWAVARHLDAPFADERARYLTYCAERGDSLLTLAMKASMLIHVARRLSLCSDVSVAVERLSAVGQRGGDRGAAWTRELIRRWGRKKFMILVRPWLRFLGWWDEPIIVVPFQEHLDEYCRWMREVRGLTEQTCDAQRQYAVQFLRWYGGKRRPLIDLRLLDVDRYLAEGGATGWCRISVRNVATALRAFLRFGATQGWSPRHLADSICAPRIYADEKLPAGPDWADVKRLLAAARTRSPRDVRDRPILMLFAVYGLRATEVAQLRLEDLDWDHDLLHVRRVKRRGRQSYPLLRSMKDALSRYLTTVRHHSIYQEVFLGLKSPFLPLERAGLYTMVSKRLKALDLRTATTHHGPHSLRHACAARLVAEGLSLKEIGDHLGHRSTSATRIYAKVDLPGLREVATFDLGELS
jgi:integrase/recombinase XerD